MSAAPAPCSSCGRTATSSRWTAINACLVPAAGFDGQEIVTAEGLGRPGDLHPVQREMADRGGSQCGYCTPGFICSMASEFYRPDRQPANGHADPEHADPEHGPNGFDLHALSGNLCRCTGYRPIRDAAYALGAAAGERPADGPLLPAGAGPVAHRDGQHPGRVRPAHLAGRGAGDHRRAARRPARGRLHRLGRGPQPQALPRRPERRDRPARPNCGRSTSATTDRDRGRPDPVGDRARAGRAGCRCWPSCSRSSRPG